MLISDNVKQINSDSHTNDNRKNENKFNEFHVQYFVKYEINQLYIKLEKMVNENFLRIEKQQNEKFEKLINLIENKHKI